MRSGARLGCLGALTLAVVFAPPVSGQEAEAVPLPRWLEGVELYPSYTEGAGLIYQHRCAGCHREEGLGPMDFTSLAGIRERAVGTQVPVEDAIAHDLMPPWPPETTVPFRNDLRLSDQEKELLADWIADGYPRGDGDFEFEGDWSGRWSIGAPDVVFDLPEHVMAADIEDEVVEFTVMTDFPDDRWIVSAEALPGDRRAVLSIEAGPLGSYRSMNSGTRHPAGAGRLLRAGEEVTVRIHYRKPSGRERRDTSRLGVIFADEDSAITEELLIEPLVADPFTIAAGRTDLEVRTSWEFPADGRIRAIRPVLRSEGRELNVRVIAPDGESRLLLSIPKWNPRWVFTYELSEPMEVVAGTVVEVVGRYDNSFSNARARDPSSDVAPGPAGETLEGWLTYSLGGS